MKCKNVTPNSVCFSPVNAMADMILEKSQRIKLEYFASGGPRHLCFKVGLHDISKNYRSRDNSICDIRIAASCDKCNLLCQAFVCCMHRLSKFDQSDGACRFTIFIPASK